MSETRWLTTDEQQVWRSFLTATHVLFESLDRSLQTEAGIPHTYYEILVRLSESPDRTLRMRELADRASYSRSRLSHAVSKLEAMGWVERATCDTDRRGQWARLTETGFAALEAAAPGHVEAVRKMLFDPLTPAQVKQLGAISDAIRSGAAGKACAAQESTA